MPQNYSLAAAAIPPVLIGLFIVLALIFTVMFIFIFSRYKKCPSDKIMVIYGNVGTNKDGTIITLKCIHGGAAFIVPIFQSYQFLDLNPIPVEIDLKGALSFHDKRVGINAKITVGISTEPNVMQCAAERLLGLKISEIHDLARDIIFGQLRLIVSEMDIEETNKCRNEFFKKASNCVEEELRKIGLRLINFDLTDIYCS